MTPNQLEKKARQLLYRKKLADTVQPLEERIKTFMKVEGKDEVKTKSFAIRVSKNQVMISLLPTVDPKQLKLRFKHLKLEGGS